MTPWPMGQASDVLCPAWRQVPQREAAGTLLGAHAFSPFKVDVGSTSLVRAEAMEVVRDLCVSLKGRPCSEAVKGHHMQMDLT